MKMNILRRATLNFCIEANGKATRSFAQMGKHKMVGGRNRCIRDMRVVSTLGWLGNVLDVCVQQRTNTATVMSQFVRTPQFQVVGILHVGDWRGSIW